jgi:hypothetical protein
MEISAHSAVTAAREGLLFDRERSRALLRH